MSISYQYRFFGLDCFFFEEKTGRSSGNDQTNMFTDTDNCIGLLVIPRHRNSAWVVLRHWFEKNQSLETHASALQ
jgi:hypothetical protein